jgi:pimeloyl-ACP methyl ester carboxylesterase
MSSIVTAQGVVHYETYGRGRPVILLHGWINSWGVWQDVMIDLAENAHYRVYALDFWGFGESAKTNTPPFKIRSYVQMVDQFMEILGIERAPVMGHSMGGTVALQLALDYPERVTRVGAIGAPIVGSSLNILLKVAALNWIQLAQRVPFLTHAIVRSLIQLNTAHDSARVRKMLLHDVNRTSMESFFRSIGDLRHIDLRSQLSELRIPILGVSGKADNIVDPNQVDLIAQNVAASQVEVMALSRHFPMLDEPAMFNATIRQFLDAESSGA